MREQSIKSRISQSKVMKKNANLVIYDLYVKSFTVDLNLAG